jgi:hypothetical protein
VINRMWAIVIVVYALLAIYDFLPLYKQKLWRDFWVNVAIGTLSFIMAILISIDVKIPSPAGPIKDFIISIFGE